MSFFKAYDMRGAFGEDFDLDTVYRVGRWLPVLLGARRMLVGRDARLSSEAIRIVIPSDSPHFLRASPSDLTTLFPSDG